MSKFSSDIYESFPGYDRFGYPDYIKRVTAGYGGETLLVFTEEKTALYDCGMAYCHEGTVENIKEALAEQGRDHIDYLLISHSHYDHIGAMPYILEQWPDTEVVGAAKAGRVFESKGAKATMKRLGIKAQETFKGEPGEILADGFRLDRAVKDGDRIDMGCGKYFYVMETKGHTDCSLTYVLEPEKLMFLSESTGVLRKPDMIHTAILKSYEDSIASADKCAAYGAKQLIGPHYGLVPEFYTDNYFRQYKAAAEDLKDYILYWAEQGLDHDGLLKKVEEKCWSEERGRAQPKAAFLENAGYTVDLICREFLKKNK